MPDSLSQIEDYHNRRLTTENEYILLKKFFPMTQATVLPGIRAHILRNLMYISWCSFANARTGTTPTTRSPGCACIAQTYVDFLNETQKDLPASVGVINTTLAIRNTYADRVLRCFDRRQVSRTSTCGKPCSIHTLGLALYANSVFLLASWTFLQFSEYLLPQSGLLPQKAHQEE